MTNAHIKAWSMARNSEKWILHTLGPVICRGNWKKKRGKCEIHTLRPGIWQENLKN